MTRAPKICSHPTCTRVQPCTQHAPKPWAGSTRRSQLPGDWDRRRRAVLDRDPICRVCGNALATEVDHVDDPHNHEYDHLQGICEPCHKAKTQAEAAQARRERR